MGYTRLELENGIGSVMDALDALLPGLRDEFERFVAPTDPPPGATLDDVRKILRDAEALLGKIRTATPEHLDEMNADDVTLNVSQRWWQNTASTATRGKWGPYGNVLLFAEATIWLWRAAVRIRCHLNREGVTHLWEAWRLIGFAAMNRTDVLVVTGQSTYSEGIRHRAQEALRGMGKTGAWWVYTHDTIPRWHLRRVEGSLDDESAIPIPEGLYVDVVWRDGDGHRPTLPKEDGPNMVPTGP